MTSLYIVLWVTLYNGLWWYDFILWESLQLLSNLNILDTILRSCRSEYLQMIGTVFCKRPASGLDFDLTLIVTILSGQHSLTGTMLYHWHVWNRSTDEGFWSGQIIWPLFKSGKLNASWCTGSTSDKAVSGHNSRLLSMDWQYNCTVHIVMKRYCGRTCSCSVSRKEVMFLSDETFVCSCENVPYILYFVSSQKRLRCQRPFQRKAFAVPFIQALKKESQNWSSVYHWMHYN